MTNSAVNLNSSDEAPLRDHSQQNDAPPQFGVVDIVEAFTAMRHEWRGQTKESRALADNVARAVANLQELEAKLLARAAEGSTDESRRLANLIADIDHQFSRAVTAASQAETNRSLREETDRKTIERYYEGMSAVARWFARPLMDFIVETGQIQEASENPTIVGLSLVLARLRRMMKEHHIERIETEGRAFDANTMHAIETVDSKQYPSGHVAEQISPCYRWHGQILRFADVRVSA